MTDANLVDIHKKLEKLIAYCYEKNKEVMTISEREICEMYLYEQGEYEEALTNLIPILKNHQVKIDQECLDKLDEAKKIMEIK